MYLQRSNWNIKARDASTPQASNRCPVYAWTSQLLITKYTEDSRDFSILTDEECSYESETTAGQDQVLVAGLKPSCECQEQEADGGERGDQDLRASCGSNGKDDGEDKPRPQAKSFGELWKKFLGLWVHVRLNDARSWNEDHCI